MMKENRFLSFFIITIIYILATVVGVLVWHFLPFAYWLNLLLADVAATIFVFIFSCIFRNASVYDPYWSVQPPVILTLFALGQELTLAKLLLLGAVWIWGIRLTGNWAYTFKNLSSQDWRYTQYEKKAGKWYPFINLT
ncbi:MAG: DUF1295 domain-containing protein, partial [Lachnospiraceae bacterium]|nr:DUF1295 domain-containing protein [Lachnospiraceae bacterium]